jgi:hypothetical protein
MSQASTGMISHVPAAVLMRLSTAGPGRRVGYPAGARSMMCSLIEA